MTIKKNQHRKGIARLSVAAIIVLGFIQFVQPAHAQLEGNPSSAARKKFQDRMNLNYATQVAQSNRQWAAEQTVIRFLPEKPQATEYLASEIDVIKADGTKASMTIEAAMHEYLARFDQLMTEAQRWKDKQRSAAFNDQDQKINAKAFDAAVNRAGYAMNSYLSLHGHLRSRVKSSFGDLASLVELDGLKLANQAGSTLSDVFAKSALRFTWPLGKGLYGGGEATLYNELVSLQKALKSDNRVTPNRQDRQAKTQLGLYLDQIREVESKGLEAQMKALKIDVTNINPYAPNARELIGAAKEKQPISLAIQAVLKKAPRTSSGGPVALVVGAAGFVASRAVMAGEADTVETKAGETSPVELTRQTWARPTSR